MIISRPVFIIFWLITAPPFVGGCLVDPTRVVVTVGEKVILYCTTQENGSITSWDLGINALEKTTVYTAPVYTRSGSVGTPEKIADGYFVTHPADNKATLYMNKTILPQAGIYVCNCNSRHTTVTKVVVLDSEPKFASNYNSAAYGGRVAFSCSVLFNASSDVSCDLCMEDASGSTVTRRNESTLNNGLISCNLKHTIIANTSSDQWYTCNVTLRNRGDIIYSRVLNTSVVWQPTTCSSSADILSTTGVRAETESNQDTVSNFSKDGKTSDNLAIGLTVTLFAVVIIAVVVYFIIGSRNRNKMLIRQRSRRQPAEQEAPRCPQKSTNLYDKTKMGSSIPKTSAASCHDDVDHDKKSLKGDELTLFENDLYSATPKRRDPSDGYFAEEAIYNEISK